MPALRVITNQEIVNVAHRNDPRFGGDFLAWSDSARSRRTCSAQCLSDRAAELTLYRAVDKSEAAIAQNIQTHQSSDVQGITRGGRYIVFRDIVL
jgi:hypothetical protein